MSETVKTVLFAAVAALAVVVAVFTYPKQEDYRPPDLVGRPLFEKFTDPSVANELKIAKFKEGDGKYFEFEVKRNPSGRWTIPSSSNYPADADAQMRDSSTSLIDLKVIGLASEDAKDHQVYGVIEADPQKLDASQQGVGLLLTVKNDKGDELAKLIIGKKVKGTQDQYFVRRPGQPQVYVVKIDPEKFPTEFDKWIERNLLKINTLDVDRVMLKDYSIVKTPTATGIRGTIDPRFEAQVTWNSDQSKWLLNELLQFRGGQKKPTELLPTEELNSQKLNDLKTALGDMKISGVHRKPAGLGADLKAGNDFLGNEESQTSLANRGFYLPAGSTDQSEIRSANGELYVGTKDGVEYVLRFGDIAPGEQADGQEGKVNRYLFVTARLDESKFPPLQLEPLPGGEEAAKEAAAQGTPPAAGEAAKEAPADAQKTDLELERDRVRKENQRKQDERDDKLKKANAKIAELNERFADWYYIIAEDEYKKVHLGRTDLIAEKSSAASEGFNVDAIRQLEQQGIQGKPKDDGAKAPPTNMPFVPGQ